MKLRGPLGRGDSSLFERVPYAAASLERLVQQGYGETDIGMMLGVTQHAVHDWLGRLGLRSVHQHKRARIWSDERRCFVPVVTHQARRITAKSAKASMAARQRMAALTKTERLAISHHAQRGRDLTA